METECILDDYPIFRNNKKTLKQLSADTSDETGIVFMTGSDLQAINFDEVKRIYVNSFGHSEDDAKSLDALYQKNGKLVFVEFKNGKVNNADVRWKAYDSLMILGDIIGYSIKQLRKTAVLIVVFNQEKNKNCSNKTEVVATSSSFSIIAKKVAKLAGKELIYFNLERFQDLYYKEVHTYSQFEFEQYLKTE